ncbi:MAG TPA: TOMM precursor leader peptide-binding protein [Propionibacteriaceae bacterium]
MTDHAGPDPVLPPDPVPPPSPGGRIGFGRQYRASVVPGEAVYLLSETGVQALTDHHLELLAPLLDGTRDLTAVLAELPSGLDRELAGSLLRQLRDGGLLAMRSELDEVDSAHAFWQSSGVDPVRASAGLAADGVEVITLEPKLHEPTLEAVERAGVRATSPGQGEGALRLVVCSDYLDPALAEINREAQTRQQPWLLAKPMGRELWLGPVFTPGIGACWACVAQRLTLNRPAHAHLQGRLGLDALPMAPMVSARAVAQQALSMVAAEVACWLAGYRRADGAAIAIIDNLTHERTLHPVDRRPQCPTCGDPGWMSDQAARPVTLVSRPKVDRAGGGHRSQTPEDVLAAYGRLISPVTGVVRSVVQDARGPAFFHSYRSGTNVCSATRGLAGLQSVLRRSNGGKGQTAIQAQVGALCEAVERHSGMRQGDESKISASFNSLGELAVDPRDCQLFAPEQYADRNAWNAEHSGFQQVPEPFDPDEVMAWTPVWSLTHQQHRMLPTAMLYFTPDTHACLLADSNGCAAGASLEDAVLQGALEVVERDAVGLWWYNRTRMPAVDLDTFTDPWISRCQAEYAALNRELWVLDLTSDLGIPVMAAVSRRTDGPREDILFGFGAHLDPALALRRCLTELNQLMPSVLDVDPADWAGDADLYRWMTTATVANQPYLVPSAGDARTPADHPYDFQSDLLVDVETVRSRLERSGLEMLVLDQTRPDVQLPVVQVIVPGLRHFWARFAPGRLFEVPVQLGRLTAPTAYDDLNPLPIFL